uniref:Ig-like domain-containing protein n=1 Tax=Macrostomum lignano TaxID=282301 RepID=A0A1I8JBA2_9PLAT
MSDLEFPRWGHISVGSEATESAAALKPAAGAAGPLELSFHTSDMSTRGSSTSSSGRTVVQHLVTVTDSASSGASCPSNNLHSNAVRLPEPVTSSTDESTIAFRLPVTDLRDVDDSTTTSTSNYQAAAFEPPVQPSRAAPVAQVGQPSDRTAPALAVAGPLPSGRCTAVAEFHKNWSSPEDLSQQSASSPSHSSLQPRAQPVHSVRFALDNIGSRAGGGSSGVFHRPRGDCGSAELRPRTGVTDTNVANASKVATPPPPMPKAAAPAAAAPVASAKKVDKDRSTGSQSCCSDCSPLRVLGLMVYYLTIWAVSAGFTWLLLEASLMLTSRGSFPYYMSPHSFCLSSPSIGFPGGNPEPGKPEAPKMRQCDAGSEETVDSDLLMQPCNLTLFAHAAISQIKRHLGYLPATGAHVTITCKASTSAGSVSLRYYSWNDSKLVESESFGSVPTVYFPMLSRWHNAPAVLVSLAKADSSVWSGKELKISCQASDGGDSKPPEREVILKIG